MATRTIKPPLLYLGDEDVPYPRPHVVVPRFFRLGHSGTAGRDDVNDAYPGPVSHSSNRAKIYDRDTNPLGLKVPPGLAQVEVPGGAD